MFDINGRFEMGLQFASSQGSSFGFLIRGLITASLNGFGTWPKDNEEFMILRSGSSATGNKSSSNLLGTESNKHLVYQSIVWINQLLSEWSRIVFFFFCLVIVVHESLVRPEKLNCLLFFRKSFRSHKFYGFSECLSIERSLILQKEKQHIKI